MRNAAKVGRKLKITTWLQNPAFRLGYRDKRCGNDYSREYELMNLRQQFFYEYGRLTAVYVPEDAPLQYQRNLKDLDEDQLNTIILAWAKAGNDTPNKKPA